METLIIRPRRMGKTTEIIKEVLAHDGILLVSDYGQVEILEKIEPKLKGKIFSWKSEHRQFIRGNNKPIFIDNADMFLQSIYHERIKGISINLGR